MQYPHWQKIAATSSHLTNHRELGWLAYFLATRRLYLKKWLNLKTIGYSSQKYKQNKIFLKIFLVEVRYG